jgi:hypothetical protein
VWPDGPSENAIADLVDTLRSTGLPRAGHGVNVRTGVGGPATAVQAVVIDNEHFVLPASVTGARVSAAAPIMVFVFCSFALDSSPPVEGSGSGMLPRPGYRNFSLAGSGSSDRPRRALPARVLEPGPEGLV